ncbi:MAG: hypothetical protein H7Z11_13960 [Verrucomicrobia bacterium]|nr:hypothetical protein [Leptolyngbya sp. ES-bin-22]
MTEPRTDYQTRFKPLGEEALAAKPVSVFLPKNLDQYVRMKPNRAEWLRQAIAEAARKELMLQQEETNNPLSSVSELQAKPQINKAL